MEKYHMDQNPYISSICSKPGVVSDNMTRRDDMAKTLGPTVPRWGRPGIGVNEITLSTRVMLSRQEEDPRWESRCGHETWLPGHPRWSTGLTSGPPEPHFRPKHRLNPPINTPLLLSTESVSLAFKVLSSLVLEE
jgi:hypothetical protein